MFVIWDTERINNTKIYMLAYIILDDKFNILEKNIVIDDSIDLSKRNSPRIKKEKFFNESIICNDFDSFFEVIKNKILDKEKISVCFGKEEFASLNDQLKLHGYKPVHGTYIDIKDLSISYNIKNNNRCNNLGSFAEFFNFNHEPHNPLSDSMLTLYLFKYIKETYLSDKWENYLSEIPNKNKVLDSKVVEQRKIEMSINSYLGSEQNTIVEKIL